MKKYSKTVSCFAITYMLHQNLGDGTMKFFCDLLKIDRYTFYRYIKEINAFFASFLTIYGYRIPITIEYDHYAKRYFLVED